MTRHDSYQYASSSTHPRAPPPLRSAQSYAAPSIGMTRKAADRDDRDPDDLTTKGRKRKRLAKACSACHKNKRRCDGFAPCSNCEFSSRPCLYLNAQGEPIPPPRTRDSSDAPAIVARIGKDGKEEIAEPRSGHRRSEGDRRPDALEAVDRDPNISLELIDHFFHHVHPMSGMFHTPTFYDRLYRNLVSPVLLDTMYIFSCRYATSPGFLACFPSKAAPHSRALAFVERARSGLDRLLTAQRKFTPDEAARHAGTWEETETIQACVILSLYLSLAMQTTLGLFYADTARDMMTLTSNGLVPAPTAPMGLSKVEHLTLLECRNRTYWCMSWQQKCWIAVGRPKPVPDDGHVPLPGGESWWARFGGSSVSEGSMRRRDGLTDRLGDWPGEEGAVGEMGYVMRIHDLATCIISLAGNATHGSSSSAAAVQKYQDALKAWAQDLPAHLRFDERNLAEATKGLLSPMHHTAMSAWLYTYMHALAECSMFFLQAIVALQPGSPWTAERQSQAVENLGVILEALGPRGRSCPMVIFPMTVITNWQDHIKSCGSLTASQRQFEERLDGWWADHERTWGVDRRTSDRLHEFAPEDKRDSMMPYTMSAQRAQFDSRTPTSAFSRGSDVHRDRERDRETILPPSSAAAWQSMLPSPPNMTDTGTTASWTLPPPTPGSASYGLALSQSAAWSRHNLAPVRQRAHSNAAAYPSIAGRSPSPPRDMSRRHLPSMSALNDREDGFRLPPLNELRMSHALKSPGEIGRNEHVFSRMTPSPRVQPDALGLGLSTSASKSGQGYQDRERERDFSITRDDKSRQQESLGIAALISAAESEQQREEEQRRSKSGSVGMEVDVVAKLKAATGEVEHVEYSRMDREVSPLSRA